MPKLKLLIAEDSKSIQFFYQKELPEDVFEKRIVADGEKALAAYEEWQPDIVMLDLNMPIMNGHQVLKAIREKKGDNQTTIIIVTSLSEKDEIIACAKVGIQGYIVKPFKAAELPAKILACHGQK